MSRAQRKYDKCQKNTRHEQISDTYGYMFPCMRLN